MSSYAKSPTLSWKEDRFFAVPSEAAEISVLRIGHEHWEPSRFSRPGLERTLTVFLQSGHLMSRNGEQSQELLPGQVLILPRRKDLDVEILIPSEIWIAVGVGEPCARFVEAAFGTHPLILPLGSSPRVFSFMQTLFAIAVEGGPERERRCNRMYELLLLELQVAHSSKSRPGGNASQRWVACKDYIDTHFQHCRSVSQWASACHLDRSTLSRLARQHGGTTAQAYLLSLRLAQARERLTSSHLSITEIAEEGGWNDPFVFSKAYRRQYGVPPSHHRSS